MANHVCPPWIGYLLINPLRRLFENPDKLLGPFVLPGMTILEPGCGMGYFTLPLARMAGPQGRVIAVDIQPKMLAVLSRRARKAGLMDRIEIMQADADSLGLADLANAVDLAVLMHVVHEIPNAETLFRELRTVLKPGGKALVIEPPGHVSAEQFAETRKYAETAGLNVDETLSVLPSRKLVLLK